MDKLTIEGGRPLNGEVAASGAKNCALPVLAACLLTDEPCRIRRVPRVQDLVTMVRLLEALGATVSWDPDGTLDVHVRDLTSVEAPYDLVRTMRASSLVLGPLVARAGRARVSLPGGCAIGSRPINLHLDGLAAMGAELTLEGGYVSARASRLHGATIEWRRPSVTGTSNLAMSAALAAGTTIIRGAAMEPEVVDLLRMLRAMGADIDGEGTPELRIQGVERLRGVEWEVIPDRIEAGTLLVAGAMTGGDVKVLGARADHLEAVIAKLIQTGSRVVREPDGVRVRGNGRPLPVDVTTLPYPGFPTDMQAQLTSLLCLAEGTSAITETIFERRFQHVPELRRLGARVRIEGGTAFVDGVPRLTGAPVMASDLRASACLVLAALAAEGVTEVRRVYHLDRGYEGLERKLASLGASVLREPQ